MMRLNYVTATLAGLGVGVLYALVWLFCRMREIAKDVDCYGDED